MKDVKCYGIIPLQKVKEEWQVLLIMHCKGNYWSFPKGHGEAGENAFEAAERELNEETGLTVKKYLSEKEQIESYHFVSHGEHINKTVTYFIAEVIGDLKLQPEEIIDAKWVPLKNVQNEITFKEGKSICLRTQEIVLKNAF